MEKSHLDCDFLEIYLPQGWFKLVKSDYGCIDCDLVSCRNDFAIFGYPVCVHYASQLNLKDVLHYVLKSKSSKK